MQIGALWHAQKPKILPISIDTAAFESRNRVLEFAGFEVVGSFQFRVGLDQSKSEHFDVVIIGDSLPGDWRLQLLRQLKQVKPGVPVVVVHQTGDCGQDVIEADANFESLDGPERLIEIVYSVVGFSPRASTKSQHRAASAG